MYLKRIYLKRLNTNKLMKKQHYPLRRQRQMCIRDRKGIAPGIAPKNTDKGVIGFKGVYRAK